MSERSKDSLNWMVAKKKIDEEPKFLQEGETVTVVYEAVEDVSKVIKGVDRATGKAYEFPVVNVKLPVKLSSGGRGFVLVRQEEFSEIAQKFMDAGFPKELVYSRPASRRR